MQRGKHSDNFERLGVRKRDDGRRREGKLEGEKLGTQNLRRNI